MLADKLRAASAGGNQIQYVGGTVGRTTGTSSGTPWSVSLSGTLTGGLASSPAAGDLVVVYYGQRSTSQLGLSATGYSTVSSLYSNDSSDVNLYVGYKFMGGSPDSLIELSSTGSTSNGGSVVVHVFRGVDSNLPLGVMPTTATGTNGILIDPPAITPSTQGSIIVSGGAGANAAQGAQTFGSPDLQSFRSTSSTNSNASVVGVGIYQWASGAFNPQQFTYSGSSTTSDSWAAVTIALNAKVWPSPQYVSQSDNYVSGPTSITVSRPSGVANGDLLVAVMHSGSSVTWSQPSGWTEVVDQGAGVGLAVAWKVASSEPSSYVFTTTSSPVSVSIFAIRNVSISSVGAIGTGVASVSAPSVQALFGFLAVFAGIGENATAFSTPAGLTLLYTHDSNSPISRTQSVFLGFPKAPETGSVSSTLDGTSGNVTAGVLLGLSPT